MDILGKFHQILNKIQVFKMQDLFIFIYLGFYVAFNTVQVISRRVVGRAEETSTYSWSRFCTVNCRLNGKQLPAFPLEAVPGTPASEVGGESVTTMPLWPL